VRYQAALRPDICYLIDFRLLLNSKQRVNISTVAKP
jgi:hypothetical protein